MIFPYWRAEGGAFLLFNSVDVDGWAFLPYMMTVGIKGFAVGGIPSLAVSFFAGEG